MLYFLDNVEDGGETAFPIADNSTFDDEVGNTDAAMMGKFTFFPPF